jgi:hypothetical protein
MSMGWEGENYIHVFGRREAAGYPLTLIKPGGPRPPMIKPISSSERWPSHASNGRVCSGSFRRRPSGSPVGFNHPALMLKKV